MAEGDLAPEGTPPAAVEEAKPASVFEWLDATTGPLPGVKYPLVLQYCGSCHMPLEYCSYGPNPAKCKEWMKKNLPVNFAALSLAEGGEDDDVKAKRQSRGGKGAAKQPKKEKDKKLGIGRVPRGKKHDTIVQGIAAFGILPKDASKVFSNKFSCSSSVKDTDLILISADVADDLWDFLPTKYPAIEEDMIEDLGIVKR